MASPPLPSSLPPGIPSSSPPVAAADGLYSSEEDDEDARALFSAPIGSDGMANAVARYRQLQAQKEGADDSGGDEEAIKTKYKNAKYFDLMAAAQRDTGLMLQDEEEKEAGIYEERTGWLEKTGRTGKGWKKRWFTLKGKQIKYFKSPESELDMKDKQPLLGMISLSASSSIELLPDVKILMRQFFQFAVRPLPGDTRVYKFATPKLEDRKSWVEAITSHIQPQRMGETAGKDLGPIVVDRSLVATSPRSRGSEKRGSIFKRLGSLKSTKLKRNRANSQMEDLQEEEIIGSDGVSKAPGTIVHSCQGSEGGDKGKKWKDSYITLIRGKRNVTSSVIKFYKNKMDKKTHTEVVLTGDYSLSYPAPYLRHMELHCNFSVTPEPGAKPVMIAVESDEEKNLWREKLERFAWTVKKQEASTREGYFYKRGKSNKDGYKKRYFILTKTSRQSIIKYFKHKKDSSPQGMLYLTQRTTLTDCPHDPNVEFSEFSFLLRLDSEDRDARFYSLGFSTFHHKEMWRKEISECVHHLNREAGTAGASESLHFPEQASANRLASYAAGLSQEIKSADLEQQTAAAAAAAGPS